MFTLNLINKEKSDIQYTIHNYPDGHKHIELHKGFNKGSKINIVCRICNGDDLFILFQIHDILKINEMKINKLHIKYLFTARCDRRFSIGEAFDVKILMELLNAITPIDKEYVISLLDVHSDRVKDFSKLWDTYYVIDDFKYQDYQICFPDKGAKDRLFPSVLPSYYMHGSFTKYCDNVKPIVCQKERNGNDITVTIIDKPETVKKPILVVDDLCDGGGTFLSLIPTLRKNYPNSKISLFVTHAIQQIGIEKVAETYNEVFITNSYKDWNNYELPKNVTVIDVS
jgi:ribose-phosphate pyrophosphokinase